MSYNIRNVEGGDYLLNDPLDFEYDGRDGYVVAAILDEAADIVCLQEVSVKGHAHNSSTLSWFDTLEGLNGLTSSTNGYTAYRGTAIQASDEKYDYNPIYYKTAKYNAIDNGTQLITDSKNSINWIILEAKTGGQRFIIVNTHFPKNDGSDLNANYRAAQATAIVKLVKETLKKTKNYNYPVILVGDFNEKSTNPACSIITGDGYSTSIALARVKVNETAGTFVKDFQDFNGNIIDHIFIKDLPKYAYVGYYETVNNKSITGSVGKYPSDHLPVVSIIKYLVAVQ